MIYIKRPFIEIIEEKYRCICDTYVDNEVHPIWFEVDKKYGKYLCTERADAYVIGLLSWAMRNKHDITCDVSVSEELLYQLNEVVIPELVKHSKSMSMIKINAEAGCSLDQGEGVGTALSCGVDSFWSIQKHLNSAYCILHAISPPCTAK